MGVNMSQATGFLAMAPAVDTFKKDGKYWKGIAENWTKSTLKLPESCQFKWLSAFNFSYYRNVVIHISLAPHSI